MVLCAAAAGAQIDDMVATTAWTAAFLRTAGWVGPIRVLAPFEVAHPPEYDLRPSDVVALSTADIVVYAGYEVMVPRLRDAVGETRMLRIATDHSPATIRASVRALAALLGTGEVAEKNLAELDGLYADWRRELEGAGLGGAAVIGHALQRPLLEALGFRVTPFGPAPPEAARIRDLAATKIPLIVDNLHSPVGAPVRETIAGSRYALLANFPSRDQSLRDLLMEDRRRLAEGWGL